MGACLPLEGVSTAPCTGFKPREIALSVRWLLFGRGLCCRKETAADTAVLLQLVRTEGSQAGVYEPKLDGSTWRKYGDKSGQPGSQGDASRGRPGAGCSVSSLAQGR